MRGGRVVAIGPDLAGARRIDAAGLVVSPGFIDIHTHYDAQVFWDPALTPSAYHGVTTVVAGNCGLSIAPTRAEHRDVMIGILESVEDMDPASLAAGIAWDFETFPAYLEAVERRTPALNFACYLGHTPLRLFVMGEDAFARAATGEEIARMAEVLAAAMRAGAAGFATSFAFTHSDAAGRPIPSRLSDAAELEALAAVLGALDIGVVEISPGQQCSVADAYGLQRRVGVPFTYGALLSDPDGRHEGLVALNRAGWQGGAQVWPQVTSRPVTVEFGMAHPGVLFNLNPSFQALKAASAAERRAAYRDPRWRQQASAGFDTVDRLRPRWETFRLSRCAAHPELVGTPVTELPGAAASGPLGAILDLALGCDDLEAWIHGVVSNDDEEAVGALLREEHCTLGLSDAGAHLSQLCDAPQATDFLGSWVRDRAVMPLEAGVRRLTGLQADLFGFAGRGYLREGAWADIAVFDPATIGPGPLRRVRDFPAGAERLTADRPSGVVHVLVNGTPIRLDGTQIEDAGAARPGRVVRPATHASYRAT